MAFEDDYVAALRQAGVNLNRAEAPSDAAVSQGLSEINAFVSSLEPDSAVALEETTGSFPILGALSDPSVGVATMLAPVFQACDSSPTRLSLTNFVEISRAALPSLSPPPPPPPNPTIDSLQAVQVTLHDVPHIIVHWSSSRAVDKYHLMYTSASPPPSTSSGWTEIEIESENSTSFQFRLSPTSQQGVTWSFKVQGCKSVAIGSDSCSPFSQTKSVATPRNTTSLRTFLQLSGVPFPVGIRSLGQTVANGVRAMMHL